MSTPSPAADAEALLQRLLRFNTVNPPGNEREAQEYLFEHLTAAGFECELRKDETIWTESCHKFHAEEVREMAATAGFACRAQWLDETWAFTESLLTA